MPNQCITGLSCGESCVNGSFSCRSDVSSRGSEALTSIADLLVNLNLDNKLRGKGVPLAVVKDGGTLEAWAKLEAEGVTGATFRYVDGQVKIDKTAPLKRGMPSNWTEEIYYLSDWFQSNGTLKSFAQDIHPIYRETKKKLKDGMPIDQAYKEHKVALKAVLEPKGMKDFPKVSQEKGRNFEKTTSVGNNNVKTTIFANPREYLLTPPPTFHDINIKINGSLRREKNTKDGLRLALISKEHVREFVKSVPNGTILANIPYGADGFKKVRAKLYEKAGFSPMDSRTGLMLSIVNNGKMMPITIQQLRVLKANIGQTEN